MFRQLNSYLGNARRMKQVLVYKGVGMYEEDTAIVERVMKEHVNSDLYKVDTVSPEDIVKGRLSEGTALLAIGGGYDLGLIEALGPVGMANLKQYVTTGGSYLGICAGAYFACDSIEFDKGGPLEVLGERSLKFCSGVGIGPLFKPYDYKSRKGASAVNIDFSLKQSVEAGNQPNGTTDCQNEQKESQNIQQESQRSVIGEESQSIEFIKESHPNIPTSDESHSEESPDLSENSSTCYCKVYFNGGCYFKMNVEGISDDTRVLSRYLDLPDSPAAIVRCQVRAGVAVLSGAHLEYDSKDIDDGDDDVTDIIPCLRESSKQRRAIIRSLLKQLNIAVHL